MAHELPPQYRAALNPREPTAHRIDRLWALHTELSTPHGLLHAAAWLPAAWPHLLQLLSDPQPELRAAAAALLGQLGALLATGREPRLAGRLPSGALFDWALALLPPGSTLPAAQRMSVETKEAALTALHTCVAALSAAALGSHAQPLLRLTCALLESASTPPRLLGPLLRLLLGVLPAVPLAALGQGFSDLADLLCGWALEPLVAAGDRQLITLVLHALRPQWHSHPDLTASLTENMLNDVKSAVTALKAAAAARSSSAQEPPAGGSSASLATSAASCMQLIALLSDIVSAASLRQLLVVGDQTAKATAGGTAGITANAAPQDQGQRVVAPAQQRPLTMQQQQAQGPMASTGQSVLLVRNPHQHPTPQQLLHQQHPHALHPHQQAQFIPLQHQNLPHAPHQHQYSLIHQNQQQQFPPAPQFAVQQLQQQRTNVTSGGPTAAVAVPPVVRPSAPPPSLPAVALAAILATRPGASTVRHLLDLYRRSLPLVQDVRQIVCKLEGASTVTWGSAAERSDPYVSRLCGCVEMLAQSITSCIDGIDPRDLDEVWDVMGSALVARFEQLSLDATHGIATSAEPPNRTLAVLEMPVGQSAGSGALAVSDSSAAGDAVTAVTAGLPSTLGVVGSAIAACAPDVFGSDLAKRQALRPISATGLSASGKEQRCSTSPTAVQGRQQLQSRAPQSAGSSHATAMRVWVYQTAVDWAMSGLSGVAMGACIMEVGVAAAEASKAGEGLRATLSSSSCGTSPGPDAEVLIGCVMRLMERVGHLADPRVARRLLVAAVLEGDGVRGVRGLRSSPNIASVTTAAKLLLALMSETDTTLATTTLHWLLADLRNSLSLPPTSLAPAVTATALTAPQQPIEASALPSQAAFDAACAANMAFICAVLQAAAQRGLLGPQELLLVEAVASTGLNGESAGSGFGRTAHSSATALTNATTMCSSHAAADVTAPSRTLSRHPSEAALAATAPTAGSLPLALSSSLTEITSPEASSQHPRSLPGPLSATGAAGRTQSVTLPQSPPRPQPLPASLTAALLDVWSVAAVALLAALSCGGLTASGSAAAGRQGPMMHASAVNRASTVEQPEEEASPGQLVPAVHAGYAAYLRSLRMLQQQTGRPGGDAGGSGGSADGDLGAGAVVQLRVVAALRRLVQHSAGSPPASPLPPSNPLLASTAIHSSGATIASARALAASPLRSEAFLTLASDLLATGMASLDTGVRAAATDCAAMLVSHVLQPSPSPSPLPTPPPAVFHPLLALALNALNDPCPAVAAAAASLAVQLTEPGLLVVLAAAASVAASAWVPHWQDELAVAPQRTAPRPQQIARLLELVFQSAAASAATATGGSVLLRKRAPNAGLGGGGSSGMGGHGEGGSEGDMSAWRLEALQRLAASLVPVVEEGGEGGGATDLAMAPGSTGTAEAGSAGDASADARMTATAAVLRSGAAAVWLAVQEGAKQLVVARLRTHLGGPTQTLGSLERMLQVTYSRLIQERREGGPAAGSASGGGVSGSNRDAAWLALELLGAIERAVAHAAEGLPPEREHLPQPVLAFFAANRKVCEEWFTRVRELLARTASLSSAHHHTLHHGLVRLKDLAAAQRQMMASLARERTAAAAAAAAVGAAVASPARKAASAAEGVEASGAGGAGGGGPSEATASAVPSSGGRHGSKQVQRGRAAGGAAATAVTAATNLATGNASGHQQQGPIAGTSVASTEDAGAGAAGGGGSGGSPAPGTAASQGVSQLEANLSRLALGVVELLKMAGGAMLATGEADSLQGLHTWAVREFEPLLRGAHLPGASALAAATAAAAAEAAQSDISWAGSAAGGARTGAAGPGSAGPGAKRRTEGNRASSRGSGKQQHKDAFAWLHGMSLQAAGSYEQALLAYNAFLAPSQPQPTAASTPTRTATLGSSASSGPGPGSDTAPTTGATAAAAELSAAAQAFVVERVGECYAALSDWSGLQGLMGAFSRAATSEPTVAGWWPAAAASLERRFMSFAAYDTAQGGGSSSGSGSSDTVPTDPTSLLLASLRALEATSAAAAPPTSALSRAVSIADPPTASSGPVALQLTSPLPAPPPSPSELSALRDTVSTELARQVDRLRASSLSDPAVQREALLHAACLRSVLRGLQTATALSADIGASPGAANAIAGSNCIGTGGIVSPHVDGPWGGLLQPAVRIRFPADHTISMGVCGGSGGGLGRLLLTPEGTLQHGILRDVAVTSALLRAARGTDPRVSLAGTRALSLEHVRVAAAGGNWGLASRLVAQSAAASAAAAAAVVPVSDASSPISSGAGERVVLSVVQSLITASAGRLLPGQVVELQLRTLLPHISAVAVNPTTAATASAARGSHISLKPTSAVIASTSSADADDLACALCTLSRWMLKASGSQTQQQQHHHGISPHAAPSRQTDGALQLGHPSTTAAPNAPSRQPHQLPPPGFTPGGATARSTTHHPTPPGPPQPTTWTAAADWQVLCGDLLAQLAAECDLESGRPGGPRSAFTLPVALLQTCYAPAAACLQALQLSRGLARAWKAWADLVYRATKDVKTRGNNKPLSTQAGGSQAGKPIQAPQPAQAVGGAGMNSGGITASCQAAIASDSGIYPDSSSNGDVVTAGYGAAAVAYCRFLSLSYEGCGGAAAATRPEDVLPVLLQLLHIIMRHGGPLEALLTEQLAAVPPRAWSVVTPQLLAQLSGAAGAARRLLAALLHAVGRVAPSLVLYPAVVEVRAADTAAACGGGDAMAAAADAADSGALVPELRLLLTDLSRSRPGLLAGVEVLVGEMERLTVLWDERWASLLAEIEVEIARRAVSLQAEATRVADDASLTPDQRQALLVSRYATLMAPAVLLLERQLRATAASQPDTPAERRFATEMLPRLRAATAALRDGVGVRDWARPQPAWAPLRAAAAALARQQRQPLPPMSQLSPRLAALVDTEVPLPGVGQEEEGVAAGGGGGSGSGWVLPMPWAGLAQASPYNSNNSYGHYHHRGHYNRGVSDGGGWTGGGVVTVAGVCTSVSALPTKTRPKRAALLGSDGATYTYLLKGREDLRMDERLMQVLRTVNVLLRSDPATAPHDLPPLRHYSVTPLGPRAGLIQWVPATTSLFAIFRHWQSATLERHAAMVAARAEGVAKAAAEGVPAPAEVEPPPAAAASRPMDLFYAKLVAALQERGLSSAIPRRDWPSGLLLAVYSALRASAPTNLLARTLWAGGGSAAASWRRQQRFARSLAAASCVGHLLGLGDRHPDNMLLEGRGAGVVHIDYNVCWDKGAKLRVPEVVPFRLTPMLVAALGVGGLPGAFRAACEAVLGCLRRRREGLVGLVDAVLSDRGVDWAVEREDAAARQDMELAVALNLFVSRAEEAKRQLDRFEEDLAALSGGSLGALLSYVEAHALAEALRNAAGEAQQRIQQAKAALEVAGRAEAEAAAVLAGAAQEAASLAAEASSLSAAVPALLQQCGAWAQQHTGALGVLRDGSFLDGTAAVTGSCFSWRAVESGAALGLLSAVAVAGPGPPPLTTGTPLALLPAAVGGESSTLGLLLPEALLLSCNECDRQLCELLPRREAALAEAISALTQYSTIVRRLLPPDYPAASYHHRWATALASLAAGGLTLPAVAQAQALAPREPRPRDVAASWQALRGAHRLAAAAAAVLVPTSMDGAAVLAGQLAGGVRVPGRELAPAVVGAGRALSEAQAGAAARFKASAAAIGVGQPGEGSVEGLVRQLLAALQKLRRRGLRAHKERLEVTEQMYDYSEEVGDEDGTAAGAALMAAGLLRLVRATEGRLQELSLPAESSMLPVLAASTPSDLAAPVPPAVPASCLSDFVDLTSEMVGLAAAATAIADANLAAAVLGELAQPPPASPQYPATGGMSTRAGAAGMGTFQGAGGGGAASALASVSQCPLPWLATAAGMASRWAELQQRLAADVGPELAGQLHVSASGTGGAATGTVSSVGGGRNGTAYDIPLTQAAVDLAALTRPVEEALAAGADARRRLEALAELVATYGVRRAELFRRTSRDINTTDSMASQLREADHSLQGVLEVGGEQDDRAAAEAELAELDAAWTARDATAAGLTAAAATATEALVGALRRWYVCVLGPGRLPGEVLMAVEAAGGGIMAYSGGESWMEAGGVGHVAVAALAGWWEQVSEMAEGLPEPQVVAEDAEEATNAGGAANGAVRSRLQLPPVMRPLWRCVEVVRHVGTSLRACQGLHLTAPSGTDGALTEAYATVLRLLARHAAWYTTSVLLPRLKRHLASLTNHLTAAVQHYQQRQQQHAIGGALEEAGEGDSNGGGDDGVAAGGSYGSRGGLSSARGRMTNGHGWTNGERDTLGGDKAAAEAEWAAGVPELVPFTAFDSQAPGEGELLGGLEDDDDEDELKAEVGRVRGGVGDVEEEGDAAWDDGGGYDGGYDNGGSGDGGRGLMPGSSGDDLDETGEGYVIDLGLDLDLDDGFGMDNDEGAEDEVADGGAGGDEANAAASVGIYGLMAGGPQPAGRQVVAAPAAGGTSTSPRHMSPALRQKQDRQHQQLQQQQQHEEKVCRLMELLASTLAAATATSTATALDPSSSLTNPLPLHHSWPAGADARAIRAARLQRLAAFEWLHEHHLLQALPAGDPRVGQALAQFFAAQAAPDPLQPSARVSAPNRLALLTALQTAVDALPALETALGAWEGASGAAVAQVMGALGTGGGGAGVGTAQLGGMGHRLGLDEGLVAQRAGALMARRQQWLAESRGVVVRVCQVSEALLQFEYSRQGITWATGGAAVADSFAPHGQLLGRAEVLARLTAGGGEAGRQAAVAEASQRAAEAARQAADARYAMEVAQYEEVSASSQLQAHLPLLVSRSLDLGAALGELEPYVRGLKTLLTGKLGLALKELSAVSAQHSAAADVASVAAVVSSYYERASQAAEALAAALPVFTTALTAADAAAPLPEDMTSEVGFLSAQLLGGQAAEAVTLERAHAMLAAFAAPVVALQPSVHLVSELPRALSALSSELTALASASASIAAAVESKHLLPPLDEQPPSQQQQPQSQHQQQRPSNEPSAGIDEQGGPLYSEPPANSTATTLVAGHVVTGEAVATAAAARGTDTDSIPSGTGGGGGVGVVGMMPDNADTAPATNVGGGGAGSSGTGMVPSRSTARASLPTGDKGGSESRDPATSMPIRQASTAMAPATAAASLHQHRSRQSAADEARRRAFAAGALRRFVAKLEGREVEAVVGGVGAGASGAGPAGAPALSVSEQVELLIRQATSEARLAVMYEGWAAWL